jgi:serine/threonine protein kinase
MTKQLLNLYIFRNILLTKDNVIKLADFGLSKCVEASIASSVVGSIAYMSPQLIKCFIDSGTYTKKTDIWLIIYTLSF